MEITSLKVGRAKYTQPGLLAIANYPATGGLALLIVSEDGEVEATATVNVESYGAPVPSPTQVWLKGWSENDGIPAALEAAGILKRNGQKFPTGFCEAELADLSEDALAAIAKAEAA